jgi:flagellar biosynthesis chaperone FliJ
MYYLNIVVGLGGTGMEVVGNFLKITNRYPLKENKLEWFVVDTADSRERREFDNVDIKEKRLRLVKIDDFNDADKVVKDIKEQFPGSNIDKIFPENCYIRKNHLGNGLGAWEIRQLGYLSLLNHLYESSETIFDKIRNRINEYSAHRVSSIKVFVISSLAGGTGSGMFLPFCAFLKSLLSDREVEIFSILATPEVVSKGTRAAKTEESRNNFYANSFQALKEMEKLTGTDHINWEIKLNENCWFVYEKNDPNFIDHIVLFHDKNIKYANLNITGMYKNYDAYMPYFQMMAWTTYFLSSLNSTALERVDTHWQEAGCPLVGMGIHVLEYPYEELFQKFASYTIEKIISNISSFTSQFSQNNIETEANNFQFPFNDWHTDVSGKTLNLLNTYKRNISHYNKRESIPQLKSCEPSIDLPDVSNYINKYYENIKNKINEVLINKSYTIGDVISCLKYIRKNLSEHQKDLNSWKNRYEERINILFAEINREPDFKKIHKMKVSGYFQEKLKLESNIKEIAICEAILNDLDLKIDFFGKVKSLIEVLDKVNSEFGYFKYSPPKFTASTDKKFPELVDNIIKKLREENRDYQSRDDSIIQTFMNKIWASFTKEIFNSKLNSECEKITSTRTNYNNWIAKNSSSFQEEIFNDFEKFLRKYFGEELKEFTAENNIPDLIKKGSEIETIFTYPFIPKIYRTHNEGVAYIAGGNNVVNLDTSRLDGFESAQKYDILPSDYILILVRILGQRKIADLDLSDYKNQYNIRKNTRTDFYKFLDPQFDIER